VSPEALAAGEHLATNLRDHYPDTLQYVTVYDNHEQGGFAGSKPVGQSESFRCAFAKIAGASRDEQAEDAFGNAHLSSPPGWRVARATGVGGARVGGPHARGAVRCQP
jgi:hypothetical protein